MKEKAMKWITKIALPEITEQGGNGLVPRLHQNLSDRFYGGMNVALSKTCQELHEDGKLVKSFIKFACDDNDVLSEADEKGVSEVLAGPHIGMKADKNGQLSTPIYWVTGDPNIPEWATIDKTENFRIGKAEFDSLDDDDVAI